MKRAAERDLDTEQRILAAAHTVFVRRGTAGARMQEIADEAGVNKALVHYYFRSKGELAAAVFEKVARGIFARLGEALLADAPIEETVERIVDVYLDQLSKTPFLPAYLIAEFSQHPERAAKFAESIAGTRGKALDTLDRKLKAGVKAGTVRRIPTQQFLISLVALCIFPFAARPMVCAVLNLDARGFDRFIEERRTMLPRFILAALRP